MIIVVVVIIREERSEALEDTQKQLQQKEAALSKLTQERRELLREAQSVSTLKAELDSMREKVCCC